ncbi:uncharacterized protein N7498_010364 [Penicillium cinerascens]|uniref:Uncharacterized protein n=1 Tax=Penicillium cinerascens TaxID=70096 RepID=A0A9W9M7A2_9EURO|nr:uncharacterized protein N7498_010364 [Penicillium cinerascens]KAJ5191379.1 hypothetical protein N7498_010364 [Penicillium cinerascens]
MTNMLALPRLHTPTPSTRGSSAASSIRSVSSTTTPLKDSIKATKKFFKAFDPKHINKSDESLGKQANHDEAVATYFTMRRH